ncbi:carboxyl transferase domain-containing protein [Streptomyces sp. NEAU-Y11]|uniref:carboxyl transferase domain-containing protein n=1 Tax=Streptomyces cucumeris TaxID=2962890 RepID=UPI0020C84350|nr:carboxyl transferase domain-containing protein [Streptomyces sp. NEAU-Y11]MCP9208918.1 carboxyl transferase [Streptomyces sp. NEAU-Y11]
MTGTNSRTNDTAGPGATRSGPSGPPALSRPSSRRSAVELIEAVLDPGTRRSWDEPVVITTEDPDYRADLERARERTGLDESVITGEGRIEGRRVAFVACEFRFLAGSIGVAAGERLVRAVERATEERLPLLAAPASGGTRMQEGTVAFLQMVKVAAAITEHKAAGLPYLVHLRHPTTGGVLASWGSLGHVTAAEPGALIGFMGPRVHEALYGEEFPPGVQVADNLMHHGLIDAVLPASRLGGVAAQVLRVLCGDPAEGGVSAAPRPAEGGVSAAPRPAGGGVSAGPASAYGGDPAGPTLADGGGSAGRPLADGGEPVGSALVDGGGSVAPLADGGAPVVSPVDGGDSAGPQAVESGMSAELPLADGGGPAGRPLADGGGPEASQPADGGVSGAAPVAGRGEPARSAPAVGGVASSGVRAAGDGACPRPVPTAEESIRASRRADRPGVRDLLRVAAEDVTPLSGTGAGEHDPGLLLALARVGGTPCVVLGHNRRSAREGETGDGPGQGQPLGPAGLRTARRGMRIAAELDLPLLTVIDTAGAALNRAAEEGGLAGEIARCLADMVTLPAPTLCLLLGQGAGGAALALLPADRVVAARHAWLSPLPPEGASAILYRTTERAYEVAGRQGVRSADLFAQGIVDRIVDESDAEEGRPEIFLDRLGRILGAELAALRARGQDERLAERRARHRRIGVKG